ncbi:hypothetical protein B0J17DRAFT_632004 [Rhizoctonia solani]|nr:hypothetical protein B0J17DRAFT_632004 [Rhizoctonia solani]
MDLVCGVIPDISLDYEHTNENSTYRSPNPLLGYFKITLYAHKGKETPDLWLCDKQGKLNAGLEEVCEIEVDLMRKALQRRDGRDGDLLIVFHRAIYVWRTELETLVK